MRQKIVVIGGGGHAKVVMSLINKLTFFEIVGYTDIQNKGRMLNYDYMGNDTDFLNVSNDINYAAFGIGENVDQSMKKNIIEKYKKNGINFPTLISPHAIINEDVEFGEGTIILDGVIINPSTRIGSFVTVYPNCVIEHDTIIEDNVYLAPSVNMCGGVIIKANSKIGNGVTIKDYITIKPNSLIESGTIIKNDF